jgi:low affinity Fe/Cu permease
MPFTPPDPGPPRSAAELNEAIRALWMDGRGHPAVGLSDEQRAEYQRLLDRLDRLRAAERGDVVEAA